MADGETGEEAVAPEEEESDEQAESGHNDDEEDVDDINHETLPKEAQQSHPKTTERGYLEECEEYRQAKRA
jgi:hypothetical protein